MTSVIRFRDDEARRSCCDLGYMRRQFGLDTARQISHRLQQLEAINSIDDLAFLPFGSRVVDDHLEVTVNDNLSLLLEIPHTTSGRRTSMTTIIIVHSFRLTSQLTAR